MSEQQDRVTPGRRDFLKLMGMGGVAGATLAADGAAAEKASETDTKPATGYRETAHVRKFYETAKF